MTKSLSQPPTPNDTSRGFLWYVKDVFGWIFLIVGVLIIIILAILIITLVIGLLSFPYYWYMHDTPFMVHMGSTLVSGVQFFISMISDGIQEVIDSIFGIIALLVLLGCFYPVFWLIDYFSSKKTNPPQPAKKHPILNIILVAVGVLLLFLIFFPSISTPTTAAPKIEIRATSTSLPQTTVPTVGTTPVVDAVVVIIDGKVNTRSLRVRNAPAEGSAVVTGLTQDQDVKIHGQSADKIWYFVEYQTGAFGWAAQEYITPLTTIGINDYLLTLDEQTAVNYVKKNP
jgi:hypothetical protein